MLSKRSFGIAGAAMLGTVALLGTNAANAAIMLDEDADAVVYAIETVSATVDDGDMYYTLASHAGTASTIPALDALDIRGPSGVGAAQDESLVVTFTLSGMVFGHALTNASLHVYALTTTDDDGDAIDSTNLVAGAGEAVLRTGGEEGGMSAVFGVSNGDGNIDRNNVMVLRIDSLGVSMGGGTVTMMVEHEDGRSMATSDPGMVQIMSGVKEDGMPMNAMTYVETSYSDFGASGVAQDTGTTTIDETRLYVDTLGSFTIGSQHLDASDGSAATMADVLGAGAFDGNATTAMQAASVTMSGDAFSFAEAVWLDTAEACTGSAPAADASGLLEDDGDITAVAVNTLFASTDTAGAESTATVTDARYLCIRVENDSSTAGTATGLTSIPRTGPYMAMTMYAGAANAMHKPMNDSIDLGRIIRDGTTVEIPYLTTDDRYNQRIIIVNRSMNSVHYEMDFTSEDGIMAERGTDGIGMLEPMSTTVLHMRRHDVVRITGGPPMRASGTLIIEAEPMYISVATNQTNMSNGGTDTVKLH